MVWIASCNMDTTDKMRGGCVDKKRRAVAGVTGLWKHCFEVQMASAVENSDRQSPSQTVRD